MADRWGSIMLVLKTLTIAAALLTGAQAVQATTLGMNTSALGSRLSSDIKFAFWDLFTQTQVNPPDGTTYTFNGVADPSSNLSGLSLQQMTAHALGVQGSGLLSPVTGGHDFYYSSTFAQNWTLSATASIDIDSISFQIKTAFSSANASVINLLYTPTLNGIGAGTFFSGDLTADSIVGTTSYVIEYRWTGLDIPAGTPLDIQFSMAGGPSGNFTRKPVDFVSLDVSSVPEPSAALCGIAGAAVLSGLRRRRKS